MLFGAGSRMGRVHAMTPHVDDGDRKRQVHSAIQSFAAALAEIESASAGNTETDAGTQGPIPLEAPLRRLLRTAGYPVDVSRLILELLATFGDPAPEEKVRLAHEPVRALLRMAGYRGDVVNLVVALLERYGDPQPGGLQPRDLVALLEPAEDLDPRDSIRRIMQVTGYPYGVGELVVTLIGHFGKEPAKTGVRPADVVTLVNGADEDLLKLLRRWREPVTDGHGLGLEMVALLGRRGVAPDVARTLATVIGHQSGLGSLGEFARIARLAGTAEDSCITMAEAAWLEDPAYAKAYEEARSLSGWGRDIHWRAQTLAKLAAGARHLEGDFVECGVDTGGTARMVMAYLGDEAFDGRTFYLFDTFRGLVPEQLLPDEPAPIEGRYPDVADVVRANFADKSYVQIVQGIVPDTLSAYTGSRVAYLHIDMNAVVPEVAALRHFWPLLAPGAPVVFDDYGFPRHREQRRALDEVAAELGVEIVMLPTCQGIVVKPATGT